MHKQKASTSFNIKAILLICLIIAVLVPFTAHAQSTGPVYIVQPGDTLFLIAQRFGTSVEAIANLNGISDPSVIVPGSELIIPGFEGVSGTLEFHEVSYGESIRSISTHFGIPNEAINKLNRILNPNRIYIGQALVVSVSEEQELLEGSRVALVNKAENRLAFAARNHLNTWGIQKASQPLNRFWIIPNERLMVPDDVVRLHELPRPFLNVEILPNKVIQGHTLVIKLTKDGSQPIQMSLDGDGISMHEHDHDQLVGLQGIHALKEPGLYDLALQILNPSQELVLYSFSQPIRVASGQYNFDPVLNVPDETIDPENTRPENELIASVINLVSDQKHWEGALSFPTAYTDAFPSYFGSRRNYNGQGYYWYHSGLDLYGGTGTPINAPARGRVVYTGLLEVRGNVTFIDHGWGVFTGYLHQSAIEVEQGDWVERGQLIGYVGGTGRVTGPHLHWEVWVGGVPVDPLEWTSNVFP